MSVRELVMLGTGAEVPTKRRNLFGLLVRWDDEGVLVDPAEGTQRQMIFADVTATSLSRVFISHFAADHCLGLAGICQRISLDRVPHAIEVAFPAGGRAHFDRLRKASVYHAAARLEAMPLEASGVFADLSERQLLADRVDEQGDVWGLRLQERDRRTMLPDALRAAGVFGPVIKELQQQGQVEVGGKVVHLDDVSVPRPGQAVAYLPACRPGPAARRIAESAAILVCRGVRRNGAGVEGDPSTPAMTAREVAELATEAGVAELVLAGFAPDLDDPAELRAQVAEHFPAVRTVEDGDRIPIPRPPKPKAA